MVSEKIAASYGRTSHDVDDAFSVDSQLIANSAYAEQHSITLPSDYAFREDFTGTVMSRPGLDAIRQLIRGGKINTLIVYHTDRLARKVGVGDYLLDELFESGIELHVVSWGCAVRDTPDDRTRFHFEIMFGDRERRLIKERTMRGKRQKLEQGIWVGAGITKYGFVKTGKKRETKLHLMQEEAQTLLQIFERFVQYRLEGRSEVIGAICDELDADTVPTPSVAREIYNLRPRWSPAMIYAILRDEAYIGQFRLDKWKQRKTAKGTHTATKRPREEWGLLEFPDLRIVPQDLWEKAQQLLDEGRRESGPEAKHAYLMNRRMRCDVCHNKYTIQCFATKGQNGYGKTYLYYACGSHRRGRRIPVDGQKCALPTNIRVSQVDGIVWRWLCELSRDSDAMLDGYQKIQAVQQKLNQDIHDEIARARSKLERYDKTLRTYADMLAEELITKEVMRQKKQELDEQKKSAQSIIDEYERKLTTRRVLTDEEIERRVAMLTAIREAAGDLETLEFPERRNCILLTDVTARLGLDRGRVYVDIYWCGELQDGFWLDSQLSG